MLSDNRLYGIKYKEDGEETILIAIKDGIGKKEGKKVISLYKEYFDEEYPTFEMNGRGIYLDKEINDLKKDIHEHLDTILQQRHDKRVNEVKYELEMIKRNASSNTVYLLYEDV